MVVYDYPPGLNQTYDSQLMDLWMVMLDSREAIEGLLTAMRSKSLRVKPGGKGIYAVINMYDGAGNEPVKAAIETIKSIPGVKLWPQQISDCNPIQRSAEFRRPAWKVPKGKGTIGATQMQQFCYEVFTLLGLPTKGPERRRS